MKLSGTSITISCQYWSMYHLSTMHQLGHHISWARPCGCDGILFQSFNYLSFNHFHSPIQVPLRPQVPKQECRGTVGYHDRMAGPTIRPDRRVDSFSFLFSILNSEFSLRVTSVSPQVHHFNASQRPLRKGYMESVYQVDSLGSLRCGGLVYRVRFQA